jgi:hypothetical protein
LSDVQEPVEVEYIPDIAKAARLIDRPHKYDDVKQVLWENAFAFPGGEGESICWYKYAIPPEGVHALGCAWQSKKRPTKPAMTYMGYLEGEVGPIRGFSTKRGHGFTISHEPSEGVHHAEVRYRVGVDNAPFNKSDKVELKLAIQGFFQLLVLFPDAK